MSVVLTLLGLVGFVILTAGTALFVAAEFSLTALERSTVGANARCGDRHDSYVQRAHGTLSFQLSGAQVGISITTLITGYLAEPLLARLLHPALRALALPEVVNFPVEGDYGHRVLSRHQARVLRTQLRRVRRRQRECAQHSAICSQVGG